MVVGGVGAVAEVGEVASCFLIGALGVGRTGYGWGYGIFEEGWLGCNAESEWCSLVEVEGRCGRIGSDDCSEESTLDLVAIHMQDVGSSRGAVLDF